MRLNRAVAGLAFVWQGRWGRYRELTGVNYRKHAMPVSNQAAIVPPPPTAARIPRALAESSSPGRLRGVDAADAGRVGGFKFLVAAVFCVSPTRTCRRFKPTCGTTKSTASPARKSSPRAWSGCIQMPAMWHSIHFAAPAPPRLSPNATSGTTSAWKSTRNTRRWRRGGCGWRIK